MQTERKEFKQLHVFVLESLPGVQLTEQLQKEQKKKTLKKPQTEMMCLFLLVFWPGGHQQCLQKKSFFSLSLIFPRILCWQRHYQSVAAAKAKVLFDFLKQSES